MSEYAVAQYGRRSCVLPEGVVYWTTGSRTYPTAHETGEDVDAMLPRSTESAKTEKTLRARGVSGRGHGAGTRAVDAHGEMDAKLEVAVFVSAPLLTNCVRVAESPAICHVRPGLCGGCY